MPISFKDPLSNTTIKVGIIALSHSDINKSWSIEDTSLLNVLSDQITITINQARLFEQSQKQKEELENTLQKLKNAQAQLVQSEKMAGLGQLVAGVAHEINTPIGSINSNNTIFSKCTTKLKDTINSDSPNTARANQLLQMLEETTKFNAMACERINEIVKSLKNFARLDESELKRVDIHDGINSTLTLVRHELKDRVKIETVFAKLPKIECYPNLLNQVFMNLIVNAIQSIKEKGSVTIKTKQEVNKIHISFTDTGEGISQENLSKIFDPGYTTKGVGVGTGLGLSICYQIIEKHNGKITAESKIGEGSTFTVTIPVNQK
jgi:signal transduction histidine kinase